MSHPIVINAIGGACPFQINGSFYGCPFYLRARNGQWTMDVCKAGQNPVRNGTLLHQEGDDPTDGYMSADEGIRLLALAFVAFCTQYSEQVYFHQDYQ